MRRRRRGLLALGRGVVALVILGVWGGGIGEPAPLTPAWKIGRAVLERRALPGQPGQPPIPGYPAGQPSTPGQPAGPGGSILFLKLSLRNEGAAGNVPVRILGRWMARQPQAYATLGTFTKEVVFKRTVILEIPLHFLMVPPAKPPLEISVLTGHQETDHQVVPMPD